MHTSIGDVLRSLLFYAFFYGGSVLFVIGSFPALLLGRKPFRAVVEGWSAWHRVCARVLLGIKVRVEGEMPSGNVLVALRHESFFEAIDLPNFLDYPVVFAKAELLRIPLWGTAGRLYGLVAVEREQGARALRDMIAEAKRLGSEGRPLAIFPEGTRTPHGTRGELQAGFAGLYKLLRTPVVPIALDSGPLYHRNWKKRGTITYRIGETIEANLPRAEMETRVAEAINVLNGPQAGTTEIS